MATVFLVLVVVLVIAGLVFGVISLLSGDDPGMSAVDPDGRARPLPNNRSLSEFDLKDVRFDTGLRGYRMSQVDRVLRRTAYDLGYKDEMIAVLEAEVIALREGRTEDAELLRKARESAAGPPTPQPDLTATDNHVPAHAREEEPEEIEDFAHTADIPPGTAEATAADVQPAATEAEPEELPREGSLRRREEPREDPGDPADVSTSDSAIAPDDDAPDDDAPDDDAPDDDTPEKEATDETARDHGSATDDETAHDRGAPDAMDRPAPHA